MHHHPAEVQTPLRDNHIPQNREEFFTTISDSNVSLIILRVMFIMITLSNIKTSVLRLLLQLVFSLKKTVLNLRLKTKLDIKSFTFLVQVMLHSLHFGIIKIYFLKVNHFCKTKPNIQRFWSNAIRPEQFIHKYF